MKTAQQAAHTPGPWRIGDAGCTIFGPKSETGQAPETVATITRNHTATEKQQANARLIAAAPDLLAALQFAFDHLPFKSLAREKAAAAIAKATQP